MAQVNYTDNGLVYITKSTFSSVTSVSIDNCFSADYSQYKIIYDLTDSVGDNNTNVYLRAGGVNETGSTYTRQYVYAAATTIAAGRITTTYWNGFMQATPTNATIGILEILNPYQSTYTTAWNVCKANSDPNIVLISNAFGSTVTTSFDGFQASFPNNTSGTIYVYGYVES